LIRFGRGREYQFFRREDVRMRWDLKAATQFLNGFRSDAVAMAQFRRQAMAGGSGAGPGALTEEQLIQVIARQMVSGELLVVLPQRERQVSIPRAPAAVQEAPPPRERRAAEPEEEIDTFDSDHDGVAQAAVLIAAAKAAFPFCQECQKHMVEQMMAPAPPRARQSSPAPEPEPPPPRAPPAPAPPPPRAPEPEPEPAPVVPVDDAPPSFDPNHDGEAQAAVLIAAAKEAYPFCEECQKHMVEQNMAGQA